MHQDFIGDSYDLVKRFGLRSLIHMHVYADERFSPEEVRGKYANHQNPLFILQRNPFERCRHDSETGIPSPRRPAEAVD